jgi:predicted TIM-barrel fold metal-dependent hydrolase
MLRAARRPTSEESMALPESLRDLRVIDVDTHLTEPHDLWTRFAGARWKDRVPRVLPVEGRPHWFVDDVDMGAAGAASVIARDGSKSRGSEFIGWSIESVHPASWDVGARLAHMDQAGIHAQILYPNFAGFGSQRFADVKDPELKLLCVTLYNDAMAQIQAESGGRLLPMALTPWWDVAACAREVERAHRLGLRGVVTCNAPQTRGAPDLGEAHWNPFWEACSGLGMPVNFHIGASESSLEWFGSSPWPSLSRDEKLAIGSALIYVENARVLSNIIFSGVLERFADLRIVSVESGIGWIPFILEALDYQLEETSPSTKQRLPLRPSEYFRRQGYGCFWFERTGPARLIEAIGVDNVLFETDFPHPTCLYPDALERVAEVMSGASDHVRRRVLQDNAAELYRIPL